MKTYIVQVACSVEEYGEIEVEAESLEEAIAEARETIYDAEMEPDWSSANDHRIIRAQSGDKSEIYDGDRKSDGGALTHPKA